MRAHIVQMCNQMHVMAKVSELNWLYNFPAPVDTVVKFFRSTVIKINRCKFALPLEFIFIGVLTSLLTPRFEMKQNQTIVRDLIISLPYRKFPQKTGRAF